MNLTRFACLLAIVTRHAVAETGWRGGDKHTHRNKEVEPSNPYALSEVVVEPKLDILGLGRFTKRQNPPAAVALKNNVPATTAISAGASHIWVFPESELASVASTGDPYVPIPSPTSSGTGRLESRVQELKRQTVSNHLFVTLNICIQPSPNSGTTPSGPPPGLEMYVSQSPNNRNPGPSYQGTQQSAPIYTTGGHSFYDDQESGDTYIGVHAPGLDGFSGHWTYQISVSNQDWYTESHGDASLLRVADTDFNSSLLVTEGLLPWNESDVQTRQQWMDASSPFGLFIYNASDPMLAGVNQSYCGLMTYSSLFSNVPGNTTAGSETGMFIRNDTVPYQRFYVQGLEKNTSYKAALSLTSRYSRDINSNNPGGGGTVWQSIDLQTRSTDNCQIIYNLTFCDKVTYSVPTNGTIGRNALAGAYDNYTSRILWPMFRNSLDQIPCNTSDDSKYSLARNCDNCSDAYRDWVCAVSIPRCADILSPAPFLKLRNTVPDNNSSNLWPNGSNVDFNYSYPNGTQISPNFTDDWNALARNSELLNYVNQTGPYKEVLPCGDLCYNLVQSCPSILGFACPLGTQFDWGYVNQGPGRMQYDDGYPKCNNPGHLWIESGAPLQSAPLYRALILATMLGWLWT